MSMTGIPTAVERSIRAAKEMREVMLDGKEKFETGEQAFFVIASFAEDCRMELWENREDSDTDCFLGLAAACLVALKTNRPSREGYVPDADLESAMGAIMLLAATTPTMLLAFNLPGIDSFRAGIYWYAIRIVELLEKRREELN